MVTQRNRAYVTACGPSKLKVAVVLFATTMVYTAAITSAACTRCGNSLYSEFEMEQGYTNFNHGSYGCVPKTVMASHQQLLKQVEANPDRWFRTDYRVLLESNRLRLAEYVGSEEGDIVFVENASAGVNAFLRSFARNLKPGALVLHLQCAYGMVKNVLRLLVDEFDVKLVEVPVSASDFASSEGVLAAVKRTIDENGGADAFSLGVISHISSIPSVVLPIDGFADLLANTPVFVDGAHAPGNIKLSLNELRASHQKGLVAYTGNLHKWSFTSKGVAFLWASPDIQEMIIPPTLSGSANNFLKSFEYTGTRDYTCFCSTEAALDFRASIGSEEDIFDYGQGLASWAGKHLSEVWRTEVMEGADMMSFMTNVRLPSDDAAECSEVAARLLDDFNIKVVFFSWSGQQWTRLSAQIYLQQSDFERLGKLVLELLNEIEQEEQICGHPGCKHGRKFVPENHPEVL